MEHSPLEVLLGEMGLPLFQDVLIYCYNIELCSTHYSVGTGIKIKEHSSCLGGALQDGSLHTLLALDLFLHLSLLLWHLNSQVQCQSKRDSGKGCLGYS